MLVASVFDLVWKGLASTSVTSTCLSSTYITEVALHTISIVASKFLCDFPPFFHEQRRWKRWEKRGKSRNRARIDVLYVRTLGPYGMCASSGFGAQPNLSAFEKSEYSEEARTRQFVSSVLTMAQSRFTFHQHSILHIR